MDGADDNQAYFSEARGRTRLSYAITQVAVQEFQVNTSNYSAQYGRAAGGVINTVTKSGTNKLHGELFFYDRDNDLGGAVNPYTILNVSNGNGGYNQQPFKPTDWRKQWGFGVGGPLIRDKLFFFYAYDQSRRNFPVVARSTDPNELLAPSSAQLPANETCSNTQFTSSTLNYQTEGDYNACALSALYNLNSFQAGSAYYQQGLKVINSFIGSAPRTADQVINLPKIDYQINDRNRLSLFYNRLRYSSTNGFYSQATVTNGIDDQGNDFVKEDFGIARLTSVLTNNIVNDGLVQYGRDFEYTLADNPAPNDLPLTQNQFRVAPEVQIGFNEGSGIYSGANFDLNRYALPDERRLQLLDGLTWSHGKNVTKFGLEYNKVSDYVNSLQGGFGEYSYDYGYTYIADYLNAVEGVGGANYAGRQLYYSYGQTFGNPIGLISTREYAGYATDDFRIKPNLTLTLGLRYEYEYVPPSSYQNPKLNAAIPGRRLQARRPQQPGPALRLCLEHLRQRPKPICVAATACTTDASSTPISCKPIRTAADPTARSRAVPSTSAAPAHRPRASPTSCPPCPPVQAVSPPRTSPTWTRTPRTRRSQKPTSPLSRTSAITPRSPSPTWLPSGMNYPMPSTSMRASATPSTTPSRRRLLRLRQTAPSPPIPSAARRRPPTRPACTPCPRKAATSRFLTEA